MVVLLVVEGGGRRQKGGWVVLAGWGSEGSLWGWVEALDDGIVDSG